MVVPIGIIFLSAADIERTFSTCAKRIKTDTRMKKEYPNE
jgi:hypothetical protein